MSTYTKQHYEDVAQFLKSNQPHNNYGNPSTAQRLLRDYWGMLCERMADYLFTADNPDFDRARFLTACGLESEG